MARYVCPKCGGTNYSTDEITTTGAGFSRFFDVQNKKFTAVTCTNCSYTEFYKSNVSTLGKIFDFLSSN